MTDENFKHVYSILLIILTIGWAAFCVWITYQALENLKVSDILTMAGSNVLLGALITWTGNVNQFWFRKSKPE